MQKGLPLAYNRDLQEDKRAVFHADDVLAGALAALRDMVEGAAFHPPPPTSWVKSLTLAEALVRRGIPFRQAHHHVGALVSHLVAGERTLDDVVEDDLVLTGGAIIAEDLAAMDDESLQRVPGSGTADSVSEQIAAISAALSDRAPRQD